MTDRASATNPAAKPDGWNTRMAVTGLFLLILIVIPGSRLCCAENITLLWDPSPSKRVVGYKVHSRTEGGGYYLVEDVGNVTKYVVRDLYSDKRYIFSVTAYDAAGIESIHSNTVYWRSRSAGNTYSNSGGGCLIASVAYGTPNAKEVLFLRQFRDRYLEPHSLGRCIISVYEWISPPLADLAQRNEAFRTMTRWGLSSFVYILEHLRRSVLLFVACMAAVAIGVVLNRRRKGKAIS